MVMAQRIVTGMRSTGKLHLGHYLGVGRRIWNGAPWRLVEYAHRRERDSLCPLARPHLSAERENLPRSAGRGHVCHFPLLVVPAGRFPTNILGTDARAVASRWHIGFLYGRLYPLAYI